MVNSFSRPGSHHGFRPEDNQDAVSYRNSGRYLTAVLADGVSSCPCSRRGAQLACDAMTELLPDKGEFFFAHPDASGAESVIRYILSSVNAEAESAGRPIEDYSSTAAAVLVDRTEGRMLFFNLGDSLIIGADSVGCRIISMPSDSRSGTCVTTTANAVSTVSIGACSTDGLRSVTICSDGAWRLMFRRSRLKPEYRSALVSGDISALSELLESGNGWDDFSLITIDLTDSKSGS